MRYRFLLAIGLVLGAETSVACADGGDLRLSERRGDWVITVFTSPSPPRVGFVDITVLVQEAESGRPRPDLPVVVHAQRINGPQDERHVPASQEAATNKLMRAASLELSEAGQWRVQIEMLEDDREPPLAFTLEIAAALPSWLYFSLWVGWPLGMIGLFAVHQWIAQRRLAVVRPSRYDSY